MKNLRVVILSVIFLTLSLFTYTKIHAQRAQAIELQQSATNTPAAPQKAQNTPKNDNSAAYLNTRQHRKNCFALYEIISSIEYNFLNKVPREELKTKVKTDSGFNDFQKQEIFKFIDLVYNTEKVIWADNSFKNCTNFVKYREV